MRPDEIPGVQYVLKGAVGFYGVPSGFSATSGDRSYTLSVDGAMRFGSIPALLTDIQERQRRQTGTGYTTLLSRNFTIHRVTPGTPTVSEVPLADALRDGLPLVLKRADGRYLDHHYDYGALTSALPFQSVSEAVRHICDESLMGPTDIVGIRETPGTPTVEEVK